jgi:phospholipid/cholesterol/gamma-HCH transport system substrate-binding protein
MSRRERREYMVGVIATLTIVAVLALSAMANRRRSEAEALGFHVVAEFARADGVSVGTPVRISGMDVGTIARMNLNASYRAVLTLSFPEEIALPRDTSAAIQTDGLFGSKFIELQPGGEEDVLEAGARLSYVQDSVILEDLVATIVARAKAARAEPTEQAAP